MAHSHRETRLQRIMAVVFVKVAVQSKMMNIPKGALSKVNDLCRITETCGMAVYEACT